jgi:hypothetical protein
MSNGKRFGQESGLRSRASHDGEYLEIELDPETLREVEELARESNCTPFEMCVILLRERLSASEEQ